VRWEVTARAKRRASFASAGDAADARAARLWQDGRRTDGVAGMDDPLKINDQIAELKRELAQLQIRQQEAQRANDYDLNNGLSASIAHGIERLEELQTLLRRT
jgi:hypothetical protein